MNDSAHVERDPETESMRQRLLASGANIYRNWGAQVNGPFCVALPSGAFVVERYEDHPTRADARNAGMFRAVRALDAHRKAKAEQRAQNTSGPKEAN